MKSVAPPSNIWTKACAVGFLLCSAQPAIHAQPLQAQPEFEVGDKWSYRHTNKGDVKPPFILTSQAYKLDGDSAWLYEETQNPAVQRKRSIWHFDYKRASQIERYGFQSLSPYQPGDLLFTAKADQEYIQYPLVVGKKYSLERKHLVNSGSTKYDAEVEAFEKVKTDAGEFDAFRIKLSGWWTSPADALSLQDTENKGRATIVIYFAPSVKRFVKWQENDWRPKGAPWTNYEIELVKWEPKAELPSVFLAAKPPTQ
nr:hypothetical protein [Rhodoferax sp.]